MPPRCVGQGHCNNIAPSLIASDAHADSGTIRFAIYKAAFFVGGAGGEGTLTFHGRYPISVGGISGGLAFGASNPISKVPCATIAAPEM